MSESIVNDQKGQPGKKKNLSAIASMILWTLAFALCFVIPGNSKFTWIPDTLLLVGFFPVMYVYPAGWTWFFFGILNMGIGIILEIGYHLPDDSLPPDVATMRNVLRATHPSLVWILLGLICAVFGAIRITKSIFRFFVARAQSRRSEGESAT